MKHKLLWKRRVEQGQVLVKGAEVDLAKLGYTPEQVARLEAEGQYQPIVEVKADGK